MTTLLKLNFLTLIVVKMDDNHIVNHIYKILATLFQIC